jgi:hypothetical protein
MTILSIARSSSGDARSRRARARRRSSKRPEQGVGDGVRLLVDLLAHEPVVAALLGGLGSQSTWYGLPSAGAPSKSVTSAVGVIVDDLVLAELDASRV